MVKKKYDELQYNTQKSLIKKDPVSALKILGLGMTERVFDMITGNFEVPVSVDTKIGSEGKIGENIFANDINVNELCSTERKQDKFFFSVDNVAPRDTKADVVYTHRSTFFAMVGHMLQMLRLRYKNVVLDGEYNDVNRFKVSMIIPVKKAEKTSFYRVPVEFLDGDTFASDGKGIKIACYADDKLSSKQVKKMKVLFNSNENLVFAYYNLDCLKLPFYCTSKGEFKGESFFFSSLVTRLVQQEIKKSSPMSNEEMQSVYNALGMNLDADGRYYEVAKYNEEEDALATINPKYAFDGVKNVLYSNFTYWFSFSEYMIAKHALKKHTMSSLQLADMASIKYDKCFGVYSYLIKRMNAVFDNKTIQNRIKEEYAGEKQAEEISNFEEDSREEVEMEDATEEGNKDSEEVEREEQKEVSSKENGEDKNEEQKEVQSEENVEDKNKEQEEVEKKDGLKSSFEFIDAPSKDEKDEKAEKNENEKSSQKGFQDGLTDI